MPDEIVFGGVATSTGLVVYHALTPSIAMVIEALLGSIDFLVDHKRSFSSDVKTHGYVIKALQSAAPPALHSNASMVMM
jgi:hypothetical protein